MTHARRLLQERAAVRPEPKVHEGLLRILNENPETPRKLRALWALHATGGLTPETIDAQLRHPDEYLRAWAIQLEMEGRQPRAAAKARFADLAATDPSPVVRLYLASACQRLPLEERWGILDGLAAHGEDAGDPNLPLMIWYAAEPLAAKDLAHSVQFMKQAKIPLLREYMSRRIAALPSPK